MIITAEQTKLKNEKEEAKDKSDDSDDDDKNSGTMIVDATCTPSQIAFPQDVSLLNKAREYSEKIIDELHVKGELKPRTYQKKHIKIIHLMHAAVSQRQSKPVKRSTNSLVISKGTLAVLKR